MWATSHIPLNSDGPSPYRSIVESIATLAYLAGYTKKIRLGISSLILLIRAPWSSGVHFESAHLKAGLSDVSFLPMPVLSCSGVETGALIERLKELGVTA